MTTEIPQKSWKQFCEAISEVHRGAVSIQQIELDGHAHAIARDVPLHSVAFQKQDECNDMVTIETGQPDEKPLQHQIVEPIRIVLRKDGESGRYNHLEILAEAGTTEIDFHPGINPALLEKLAA